MLLAIYANIMLVFCYRGYLRCRRLTPYEVRLSVISASRNAQCVARQPQAKCNKTRYNAYYTYVVCLRRKVLILQRAPDIEASEPPVRVHHANGGAFFRLRARANKRWRRRKQARAVVPSAMPLGSDARVMLRS